MRFKLGMRSAIAFTPMKRDDVLSLVKANQSQLQSLGVISLNLFGSVARDEARLDSDVDFLVELSRPIGLFRFIQIKHYLEDLLGCPVDIGTIESLNAHLREPALEDVIRVF